MVGYSVLWQGHFWLRRPADWQVCVSMALLAIAVLLSWTGARALGRHLRFEAALRTDHKLVQTGPYRFIRHPIYASMLCLLLGTGVMIASPLLFVVALAIFIAGTEIRVRTEDRLLAEHFGPDFVAYRRRVHAYIPMAR
jgi:protein-S-isoprenylcysteine O-methyltransferase Ste14